MLLENQIGHFFSKKEIMWQLSLMNRIKMVRRDFQNLKEKCKSTYDLNE